MSNVTSGILGNPGKKAMKKAGDLMSNITKTIEGLNTAVMGMSDQVDKNRDLISEIDAENIMLEAASKQASVFSNNMQLLTSGKLMVKKD